MAESGSVIVSCKIHPAIGVARVGNSTREDGFFLGPEIPGGLRPPAGGYKDPDNPSAVLRQAARFHVFGYDAAGIVVREITKEAAITWTVRLANKKAAWHRFAGADGENQAPQEPFRNAKVVATDPAGLIIDTGEVSITGSERTALAGTLGVTRTKVTLGEVLIRADDEGCLVVLGGSGEAHSWETPPAVLGDYANNDGWYDTTSDGPVSAAVKLAGEPLPVLPAWVIVGPPNFAPPVGNVVTMYDVAYQVAVERGWVPDPADQDFRPSFAEHVGPLLRRIVLHQWVSRAALRGHGPGRRGDFSIHLKDFADNDPRFNPLRQSVLDWVREPDLAPDSFAARNSAHDQFMPRLSGDAGEMKDGEYRTWLTVTRAQYEMLRKWAIGRFDPGTAAEAQGVVAAGLDRAALESCVGGAFYPGIEAGWIMRRASQYKEFCRLDPDVPDRYTTGATKLEAGDVTKRSALPWQADFHDCRDGWWPAQRPDDVLTFEAFQELEQLDAELETLDPSGPDFATKSQRRKQIWMNRAPWAWEYVDDGDANRRRMVENWHRLGFVVSESNDGSPLELRRQSQYVEVGRDPGFSRDHV